MSQDRKAPRPNVKSAIRLLIRNLLRCFLMGFVWSVCFVLATLPFEALFGVGAMLWYFLFLGVGLLFFVCRKTGRKPPRFIDYKPAAFSMIWLSSAAFTVPVVRILGKATVQATAPLAHFLRNFFGS